MSTPWFKRRCVQVVTILFVLQFRPSIIKADDIDNVIELWMAENNVRGAAVSFYDGVR
jgi:hypothetical protein